MQPAVADQPLLARADWRVQAPDAVLLRRFGYVRAVGGVAWTLVVALLVWRLGATALPLALGVPVLVVVTAVYFARSLRYPRTMVTVSLVADAVVLASAIAFFGGTGAGLVLLYAIVVVSAGLLLGPGSAAWFTLLCLLLGLGQLGLEQLGLTPELLHRHDLGDRLAVLAASSAGLVSVGYLSATYASRLHELIAEAGLEARRARDRGQRRRRYVEQTSGEASRRLAELGALAEALVSGEADPARQAERAARLRRGLAELDTAVAELGDAAALDLLREARPEPVALDEVVAEARAALSERLDGHVVTVDVPAITVVGDERGTRRAVHNLLENVAEHTPEGTRAHIAARRSGGHGVLAVTDDGPGVPEARAERLFEPDGEGTLGLPLVRELCEAMGAEVHHETSASGGARFVLTFRLAPGGGKGASG